MENLLKQKLDYRISVPLLSLSLLFLYLVGVEGLMKSDPFGDDFSVFYRAGTALLDGQDPWFALIDSGTPFSYPPHTLFFVALYGLLDFELALAIHTVVNFASVIAIAFFVNHFLFGVKSVHDFSLATLLPTMLLIGNPYMATTIHQGQLTLPAVACVLLSWLYMLNGRQFISAGFLCAATIKPPLALLYVLWLLLDRRLFIVLLGGLLSVVLMVHGALVLGPVEIFASWLESMSGYSEVAINAPGSAYVVGLESLFVAHGVEHSAYVLRAAVLPALILLYWQRHRFDDIQTMSLLFTIGFTFLFAHDYDYVAVVMVFSYCLYLTLIKPSMFRCLITFTIIFWFFMPQRLLRDVDIPVIIHARSLLLLLCCYLVYCWSTNDCTEKANIRSASI